MNDDMKFKLQYPAVTVAANVGSIAIFAASFLFAGSVFCKAEGKDRWFGLMLSSAIAVFGCNAGISFGRNFNALFGNPNAHETQDAIRTNANMAIGKSMAELGKSMAECGSRY